ncbi:hypothetical protein QDY71_10915 [Kingella negevensis]|uniref:hypothetical protein n=1 Tax=Kingella negevensis TaxID=1522312 RepID=UPI00254F2790|nr:hypothetical protein [Kingella negevensis]MDK4679460.1 hypothetical protein [Kingella negevensis]MDK4682822.1 hypothetical protein [Kingella negevensis]MDK4684962.1 hypothetical protein [Kingella negevensis]MDK4691019.1 hypothetical protein [Kingella negevensis]MDK4693834.1 hypothetical protein [Kingella negevensis]
MFFIGITQISLQAGGNSNGGCNGYYTWAVLGFNCELPQEITSILPDNFKSKSLTYLHELLELERGKEWWKNNGISLEMCFDLQENSPSMRVFSMYLKEKYGVEL